MQFIANGPTIPDALLQSHDEGSVVFFCGAGVSYPAGLPGFKGLVDDIYGVVGTTRTAVEEDAYTRNQFDATLDLLERRVPGQRLAVRAALAQVLKPNLRRKGATDTHAALLHLARNRDGALRLVTTNFDRVFERVITRGKLSVNTYAAPMLPIPKSSRWNGLVYLHGVLPKRADESALHRLVITSGDFGLAYLTERWAARFVSELFRNYVVCFVGYSINDPVLRYMMDALAADRMLGEATPQAYAFADCESGQEAATTVQWEAKGVIPILYDAARHDHSALHNTLRAWAETHRDGVLGREQVVVEHALARPSASTRQDDFVGRMLWAISHASGLPARRFADFNPVPSLEWLESFSDDRYQHGDLHRFGVPQRTETDGKLRFSLLARPAPYTHAPWMALVSQGGDGRWDDVTFQIARWLCRHLNDPALVLWLAQRGGQLHSNFQWLVERELDRIARLQRDSKTAELDDIRTNSANGVPQPPMLTLWRLLLTGRVKSPSHDADLYRWIERLKRDGLTATHRLQLRELLTPKVTLRKPFSWGDDEKNVDAPRRLRQLVDWKLVLTASHVHSSIRDTSEPGWQKYLPLLTDDFQQLLRDALDLLRELGEADDRSDRAHWDLPSISPHWQNRAFRDWVVLIELLRDAWLATRETEPDKATRIAKGWFALPYPTFKRLALFAASHEKSVSVDQWVDWLVVDDAWWLWSVETQRETMRLVVLQGAQLSSAARTKLETAILTGPPRAMYRNDIEPARWQSITDGSMWIRLAKLQQGSGHLGDAAAERFHELSTANPDWKLQSHERDEFSHWQSGTGDPDYRENRRVDLAPRRRHDLVKWLKQPSPTERSRFNQDTWLDTCRTRFFHAFFALCDLAQEAFWPAERWREALQAWSEDGLTRRSWQFAAPLVEKMPDDVLEELAHSVAWWLHAASKILDRHEFVLLSLCERMLALPDTEDVETDDPVGRAINHPVGHVTQALLNVWFMRKPDDNDSLPKDIEAFFTRLCDTTSKPRRYGRVLLASQLIALFRVDRAWTESHLLPLFDWNSDSVEAQAAWEGFLWSPRLYDPLLIALKSHFLATAHHYSALGEHGRQFAAFLTYAGLNPVDGYSWQDFQSAIGALPHEGLQESAQALAQALEGAGEQVEDYWRNRVHPFWQHVWPKYRQLASPAIAESLVRLSIAARGEFPSALSDVHDWLQPIEHPHYEVNLLHESGLPGRFPEATLLLLDSIIVDQVAVDHELSDCLKAIVAASPALLEDLRYKRLVEYSRRRSI